MSDRWHHDVYEQHQEETRALDPGAEQARDSEGEFRPPPTLAPPLASWAASPFPPTLR